MHVKRVLPMIVVLGLMVIPAIAEAQYSKPWKDWYGHVAGSYTLTDGDLSKAFNDGWGVSGGATYRPDNWFLGITGELAYNDFGMTAEARDFFESSGGDGSIWSLTGGLVWGPKLSGKVGFNLQAGIGGYYLEARLKEPAYVCGPICDPLYPWWCWWGCTPGNVITDSKSSTEFGYYVGAAITFELASDAIIYVEAKYHTIETEVQTTYIPISVGMRW
jgi:hypothetical protein